MDTKESERHESTPPPYSAKGSGVDQPPAYAPPTSYKIGAHTFTDPLVQVQELKAHLALLRAFKDLRATVEKGEFEFAFWPQSVKELNPQQTRAWFVGLAVDR